MLKSLLILLTLLSVFSFRLIDESVNIGDRVKPDASTVLQLSSTTKGFAPPRMTQTERNAISTPIEGLIIFNTDTAALNVFSSAAWVEVGSGAGGISAWITANAYLIDDVVHESNRIYLALTNHTSGTFATDLTNNEWVELSTATLQLAYDDSTAPQTILNSTLNGLEVEDAATPIGVSLFTVQSSGASTKFFDVLASQINMAIPLVSTSAISSIDLTVASTTAASTPAPVMTEAQRDAIGSPVEGDQVFNSTTDTLSLYTGAAWTDVAVDGQPTFQSVYDNGVDANVLMNVTTGALNMQAPASMFGTSLFRVEITPSMTTIFDVTFSDINSVVPMNISNVITGDSLVALSTTETSTPAPVMTEAQRDAIGSPAVGEQVFNSTTTTLNIFNGSDWVELGTGTASTGLLNGGLLSIGAPTTTFSISDGAGQVVDSFTDSTNPIKTNVTWTGLTNIAATNLAGVFTIIGINSAGTVIQKADSAFTAEELRDNIFLGALVHIGSTVEDVSDTKQIAFGGLHNVFDLSTSIGLINVGEGNVYGENGANLNLDKSAGSVHSSGANYINTKKSPNILTTIVDTGLTFNYNYQDGAGGFTIVTGQTALDPGNYDDGDGTLASVGTNNWSVQRVFFAPTTGDHIIQYGQAVYNNFSAATQGLTTEVFVKNPVLAGTLLRSFIIVRGGASDLSDTGHAVFVAADKFGQSANGGVGSIPNDYQAVYDNSVAPQVTLDSTRLGMQYRDASTPIGVSLFAVQDNAGTTSFFDVLASQIDITVPLISTSSLAAIDLTITSTTNSSVPAPLMTEAQRDAIGSPAEGDQVFNSDQSTLNLFDGTSWVSVGVGFQGNVTDWEDYTPTFSGLGTVTSIDFRFRQVGDSIEIHGKATTGTATASEMQVGLPTGLTVSTSKVAVIKYVGKLNKIAAIGTTDDYTALITGGDAFLNFGNMSSSAGLTPQNGSVVLGSTVTFSFFATVPIQGFTSGFGSVAAQALEPVYSVRINTSGNIDNNITSPPGWITDSDITQPASNFHIDYTFLGLQDNPTFTGSVDSSGTAAFVATRNITNTSADFFIYNTSATSIATEEFDVELRPSSRDYNTSRIIKEAKIQVAILSDVKSSGTTSGTFTLGAYRKRTLNTISGDNPGIVSLSSDVWTLQAGRYKIKASAATEGVSFHKLKIVNTSDTINYIGHPQLTGSPGLAVASFTITSAKTFELQHRSSGTGTTNGFGQALTYGDDEVYAIVTITKYPD